ncbi:ABC transporter related [Burkholderia multivorans CGD1]|nr:ABC transporter related [Burkholderia multivorans CGD1]
MRRDFATRRARRFRPSYGGSAIASAWPIGRDVKARTRCARAEGIYAALWAHQSGGFLGETAEPEAVSR